MNDYQRQAMRYRCEPVQKNAIRDVYAKAHEGISWTNNAETTSQAIHSMRNGNSIALKHFLQDLGWQDISTNAQVKNGTTVFAVGTPNYEGCRMRPVTIASYNSGYIRKFVGYSGAHYQLNKTFLQNHLIWSNWSKKYYNQTRSVRILIPAEVDRLIALLNHVVNELYNQDTARQTVQAFKDLLNDEYGVSRRGKSLHRTYNG